MAWTRRWEARRAIAASASARDAATTTAASRKIAMPFPSPPTARFKIQRAATRGSNRRRTPSSLAFVGEERLRLAREREPDGRDAFAADGAKTRHQSVFVRHRDGVWEMVHERAGRKIVVQSARGETHAPQE